MNRDICRGLARAFCARGHHGYRWFSIAIGVLASFLFVAPLSAAPQYAGSSNLLPSDPTWHWGYEALDSVAPFFDAKATAVAGGGVTTLDTSTQITDRAGFATHIPSPFTYTDPDVVPLNVNTGFELDFTVKLLSEDHGSGTDRAGFSVIALSSDPSPVGVELGFWTNEVWAQNVGFTHGESSAPFDTTASLINYRLAIQGSNYTLFANNSQILTGALRNYAGGFPYNQPNFTFFGDDTGEADAKVQIANFNVVTVPEPAGLVLALEAAMLIAICGVLLRRQRRQPVPAVVRQRHF